jgi:hypothetical protein
MSRCWSVATLALVLIVTPSVRADDKADLAALLGREIIGPKQSLAEVKAYLDARVPRMPKPTSADEWTREAERIRAAVLERVVYRGEAAHWRDAKTRVEWLDTIKGGDGYHIKKLRYEALPGLWIPALLYEPEKLSGKVPVAMAVNGHDANGKAAGYKQTRCINMAKRGMIVLNCEWFGMGQLRTDGFAHGRMNQLDLCGTCGLAPFYLSMKRGLDVLLAHEHADPKRVCVSGLSGGGWQTITISSLDTRVTLSNPVAGYSSFRTRIEHYKDLGDSEQTPNDLAAVADYTHLTALLAPRAALLTFNSKDDCCFESGYALSPLMDAARPMYSLYGREDRLRSHVNDDPGTHNFEKDNREALYRAIGDYFFAGDKSYKVEEIPCKDEVKTKDQLNVELPKENADFHTLALTISKGLPHAPKFPTDKEAAVKWQRDLTKRLREVVSAKDYTVRADKAGSEEKGGIKATYWKLKMGDDWTVPLVELVRGEPKGTTILVADAGRKGAAATVEQLLAEGRRVLAVDPFYFGESKIAEHDWLFAILVAAVGDRPLGLQAGQLAAVARWWREKDQGGPMPVVAIGPRSSLIALVATALEPKAILRLELHGAYGSLKEVIEQDLAVNKMPEMFCFGLLEAADVKEIVALVAPRPVRFVEPSKRATAELAGLKEWYTTLGADFDPLK